MPSPTDTNPLLKIEFRVPFDAIRAEHVEPAIQDLLRDARERLEALASSPGPRTFENTLEVLDGLTERLDYAMSIVRHLESVATTPELRAAYNAVQPEVSAFFAGIPLHEGLWKVLKEFADMDEAHRLSGARARFLKKTLEEFRRHGAELDAESKGRLKDIEVELAQLTMRFSENVLDATNAFELVLEDPARLAGLPSSAVAAARASAASKGPEGWRFTLQAPSYMPLMTYLDDGGIREQVYRAYSTRAAGGEFDNRPLVERILALRRQKADLLGFGDFAGLVLEDRMARTAANAQSFLDDLREKTEAHFRRENEDLAAFRRARVGEAAPPAAWDIAYWAEKQRAALYDFDEEALRPYFPLPSVIEGMFAIFGRLLEIRIEERPGAPAWDPAVRYFEIRDAGGELLGAFYADLHPRENKRGGAWMDAFITGGPSPEGFRPHLGLIAANLTPPLEGRPALLTHREVETIFHEFGHLQHHCLSRVELRSQAGTNVAWDFVELPSQIMENWCWEREAVNLFAHHWETGDAIPEELFERMKRARTYRAANGQMRQVGFGCIDLALHTRYAPGEDGDAVAYVRRLLEEFSPTPLPAGHALAASFTHLFSNPVGYAAGYYSYKWAEVLDADAFTLFRRAGVFNPEAGRRFREHILAPGDSRDPAESYRALMGRDPDPRALLERLGLAGSAVD